ncbi:MAG TPA: hypothetical protein VL371_15945 [Gemmataceae bacterium]|nr:hypothetical protein [Gemmataceae bacterium]
MNYRVRWRKAAKRQLADVWIRASDRAGVTAASDSVDPILGRNPHAQGESRSGSRRIWIVEPLVFFYDIDDANRTVTVVAVSELPG